jgi:Ferredoxin-dependent bilin reductase
MSMIFDRLIRASDNFLDVLARKGIPIEEDHDFDWPNYVFRSGVFRRAHLDVVDARDTKKLYMMHLCIFPHTNDPGPIYGFDLIAGPNKVTGAFHDFSPGYDKQHYMLDWFHDRVDGMEWSKKRELPQWAKNIFSGSMVAAGNINTMEELDEVLSLADETLIYYLDNIGNSTDIDSTYAQNWYCHNQRQNPHTPKVMESLGFDFETVQNFITSCLFPIVK